MAMQDTDKTTPVTVGRFVTWHGPTKNDRTDTTLDTSSSVEDWTWSMTREELKPLPLYLAFRRTSAAFNLPIGTVLERIALFMRIKSISCEFDALEGTVSCLTKKHAHFLVYVGRSANSDAIHVALERRQGCAVETHHLRRALFQTIATGNEPPATPVNGCTIPLNPQALIAPLIKKLYNERFRRADSMYYSTKRSCREGMNRCVSMLVSKHEDQQRLGMESLVFLTDPNKVPQETADDIAGALVYEEDMCPHAQSLREQFVQYFEDRDALRRSTLEIEPVGEFDGLHHYAIMHDLSLQALANALQVLKYNQEKKATKTMDLKSDFWSVISAGLVYDLTDAVARPQDAAMSAKCLYLLIDLFPKATQYLVSDSLLPYLLRAHRYGEVHHLALEQETQQLLSRLEHRE